MTAIIIVAALVGFLFGGLRGLLVGAVLGYLIGRFLPRVLRKGLGLIQAQYIESTFAAMGALCKADSLVTRDEINTVEALFERMRLSGEQREAAKAAFNRGKAPDFDLDAEIVKFRQVVRGQSVLLRMFLQVQLLAVAADGTIHPAEHEMLVRMARGLGLPDIEVARLEAMLRASTTGPGSQTKLEDAYEALGLSPSASDAEVKRTYRKLMSENHPDKMAGKGLPESMRALAEERSREITVAYGLIKDARRMK
jgi:DnaJ like chaperone protein